jgi:tetratricopeptide (TPR) repeat protein
MEQYRETTKPMPQIGRELGVTSILEGGVQRAGGRVRINVQLIDAATDEHLWAETFDRELTTSNIFKIQSEIATAIARALHATLSPEEQQVLDSIPTESLEAYEFFQRAQLIRRTLGLGSRKQVAQLLEQAVSLDPGFAIAHVNLAHAYIDGYFTRDRDESYLTLARAAIDKAFELIPGMPEAHIAMSRYYYQGFLDYARALEHLDIAIPLVQGNAEAYAIRAFVLRRRGDIEDAIPDLLHAIELDPGNFSPHYVLAETYVILGLYEQAIDYYNKAVLIAPNNFGLRILRAYAQTDLDINSSALRDLTKDPTFADSSGSVSVEYRWKIALSERNFDLAMDVIRLSQSEAVNSRTAYYPLDLMRGLTEFYLGDQNNATGYFKSAKVTLESQTQESPEDPRYFSALGFAHAGLGDKGKAVLAAKTAYELNPVSKDAVDGPLYVLNYAMTYAMVGEYNAAIDMLEELLSRPSNWYATLNVILREPAFEKLRDEPAFILLVEKHRLRD